MRQKSLYIIEDALVLFFKALLVFLVVAIILSAWVLAFIQEITWDDKARKKND